MQIGLRLHDSAEAALDERLKNVREQGFVCAHVALSKLPGETADPAALTPGYAMYLRHAFERAGLDIAVLGNYLNLAHPDQAALRVIQKKYEAHLCFASLLGCGMVGTETGALNAEYKFDREACRSEKAFAALVKNLKPVVKTAERMGMIMAIEPVAKHIIWNPRAARMLLDVIDSPNLKIIFDPVNLLERDNLKHRDEVIAEAIDLFGDEVAMIHLKDYRVNEDGGEPVACACGLGEMDYRAVLKFAKERKPHIQATLENTKPDNAVAARELIERLYNEA